MLAIGRVAGGLVVACRGFRIRILWEPADSRELLSARWLM
eukprot:COSAG01_NODE_28745_length_653_cov_12.270758_1_plen_39_part_01